MEVLLIVARGKYIAVRPDNIIEARYDLTAKQNDILDMVLAEVQEDDNYLYELNIEKYKKLYKKNTSNIYRDFKMAIKEFEGKGFYLTKPSEGKQIFFVWFASIYYSDYEGKIVVEIGKKLKELLLEMKRKTFYRIEYPLNFTSIYSKRIYYYLKRFEDTGWRIDNLDELRQKLQCPESYKKYGLFRTYVLEQAQKEINQYSDISFDYEEIKEKRKVVRIKFLIYKQKRYNKTPDEEQEMNQEYIDELATAADETEDNIEKVIKITEGKLSNQSIQTLLKVANNDIEKIREKYKLAMQTDNIKDLGKWLYAAILNDYSSEKIEKNKKRTFNNFRSRYDDDPGYAKKIKEGLMKKYNIKLD